MKELTKQEKTNIRFAEVAEKAESDKQRQLGASDRTLLSIKIAILVFGLLFAYIFAVAFWPWYDITEVRDYGTKSYVVLNQNKTVEAGGHVDYEIHYCKNHSHPTITERYLYRDVADGGRDIIPLVTLQRDSPMRGCPSVAMIKQYIPPAVPPGKWKMMTETTYYINSVKRPVVTWSTDEFTVIPPKILTP